MSFVWKTSVLLCIFVPCGLLNVSLHLLYHFRRFSYLHRGPYSSVFNMGSTVPDVSSASQISPLETASKGMRWKRLLQTARRCLYLCGDISPTITTGAFERGRKVDYIQCAGGQTATVAAKALNLPRPYTTTASRPNNMPLYRRLAGVSGLYLIRDTLKGLNNWERPNAL